ncbi:gamma-glutamyltranspeptidase/glutathione hydrolase [Antricoccus suffuscus]|uniref:Gamma-glutamyltranspeptidase/glutathione hydrolase n=1 Tax=Antricoccus suffuscus TaxID=1629062 RepID=A0A2T1A6M9_9ACTN|nr:gamma-glutamyltransferase [Antricoccus suffuscus]PRZ44250.1 gamma-glutamyltranspeptidase/glutathione hydrolase [Antricoccus suffuscus]
MFTTRPELTGTFGAVASTHYLASQCGMAVLEEGGNAFDAAVATAFVMQVVEPHLNGPGGDMPLIMRKQGESPKVLCAQGVAPMGATIEHYRSLGLDVVPGTGLLAPALPGAVPGWLTLLRDYGTRTPRQVMRFAIEYAGAGHPLIAGAATTIDRMAGYFTESWPTSAATWLPNGQAPQAGEVFRNPTLAATYSRLCDEAEAAGSDREAQCDAALRAWSHGFVAEAIDAFARQEVPDSSGARHAGVMTGEDLARWTPTYEEPLSLDWRGKTIYKCGPWSQGVVLLEQLAILDGLLPDRLEDWDAATIHSVAEAAKLAFADRDAFCGDSLDNPVDVSGLLDPAYVAQRRALIGAEASLELRPGSLNGVAGRLASAVQVRTSYEASKVGQTVAGIGEPTIDRKGVTRGDTCHLDVVDRWGNVVSSTPSGGWLQSSPTIPALGFALGSRLQMTWLEEGLPSSLRPGRRPRSTLTPSLSTDEHDVTTSFGTPGGDQQDQWQLVFLLGQAIRGLNLQEAIDAPSWHSSGVVSSFDPRVWEPGVLDLESRIPDAVIDELADRGHRIRLAGDWALGRMSAASYDPRDGLIRAGANPRGMQGYAVAR